MMSRNFSHVSQNRVDLMDQSTSSTSYLAGVNINGLFDIAPNNLIFNLSPGISLFFSLIKARRKKRCHAIKSCNFKKNWTRKNVLWALEHAIKNSNCEWLQDVLLNGCESRGELSSHVCRELPVVLWW